MGESFDPAKLRYNKIILLMDADSDGNHIATLLLTFFYNHIRPLIDGGFVYLAQPPLYRIDAAKETYWALDDLERDEILSSLGSRTKATVQRFKGLGEMPPATLKQTTLDPSQRTLLQVCIEDQAETDRTLEELMGSDPAPRFKFLVEEAARALAEELDV
jgi:DNA gyrase/topoisomerase IV subunit B